MKILPNLVLALSMTAAGAVPAAVQAAEVVPAENRVCTRDFNAWGHASRCSCPSEAVYDQRSAFCLQGELEPVQSEGYISPVMAIGGETTGIRLQSLEQDSYELILPLRLKNQLEAADGQTIYEVYGDYLEVPGIETSARPTIIVDSLRAVN